MIRRPSASDVEVLLDLIQTESDEDLLGLMNEDLEWSAGKLAPAERARALIRATVYMHYRSRPEEVRATMNEQLEGLPVAQHNLFDVAVVTVKDAELDAVKAAFGLKILDSPDHYARGAQFFECEVARPAPEPPLRCVITKCGVSGNPLMAAFLQTVFSSYQVRLCCLVGMAAGHESEASLGDAVLGTTVVDYGRRIATLAGVEVDHITYAPDHALIREMSSFNPVRHGWHEQIREVIKRAVAEAEDIVKPASLDVNDFCPSIRNMKILAADELVEDDSIPCRAGWVGPSRRVGAIEMEGSGFAAACQERDVPWLVLRGIADFGRPGRSKEWQFISTVSAATALRMWLQTAHFLQSME